MFFLYILVCFGSANESCSATKTQQTHPFCKSWCCHDFWWFKTAGDREIPDCWEHEKCCICNLSSHFFGWRSPCFSKTRWKFNIPNFWNLCFHPLCAALARNRFRKWELTAFVQRFHLCVQHHVGGSEIVPNSWYRFVSRFRLCFLMRWLQAYCNKSGNAVLVKDKGVGCCQSGLLEVLESLQSLKLFACRMTSAGL